MHIASIAIGGLRYPDFEVSFNTGSVHVKAFLPWAHAGTAAPTTTIGDALTKSSQRTASELFTSGFAGKD